MAIKNSYYDQSLYGANNFCCWAFGLTYIAAYVVSIFKPRYDDRLQFLGLIIALLMLYEVSRTHKNIENIVERHKEELHNLKQENYALKDEIRELKAIVRDYE